METTTDGDSNSNSVVTASTDNYITKHDDDRIDFVLMIIHNIIASVGIIGNITVVIVLSSDKKIRSKVPNIFIINQVCNIELYPRKQTNVRDTRQRLVIETHVWKVTNYASISAFVRIIIII